MPKKILSILIFNFLFLIFFYSPVFARDPYPNRGQRVKAVVAPVPAWDDNPKTMLKSDGSRGNLISFSCYTPNISPDFASIKNADDPSSPKAQYVFINDINIDTQQEAESVCKKKYPNSLVKPPFLKTNVPGKSDYDATGYDLPIGAFFGRNSPYLGWDWRNAMPYGSIYKVLDDPNRPPKCSGPNNTCNTCVGSTCDNSCQFKPGGPPETWVKLQKNCTVAGVATTCQCLAPPYSYTEGDKWWNWYKLTFGQTQNIRDDSKLAAVQGYLGMDGEGRPLKSGPPWNWETVAPGETDIRRNFFGGYVQASFNEMKKKYPNKTIRFHFADGIQNALSVYLENGIDLHWESLEGDEEQAYWYAPYNPYGWHQIFANNFFITNTLGLGVAWRPWYQAALSALSKHTDGITGIYDERWGTDYQDGRGDFIKFVSRYTGKDINDTPGVWISLRDTMYKKEKRADKSFSGKYGDYDFYLYRPEELDGNHTVPVKVSELPSGVSNQLYSWKLPQNGGDQFVGRKNAPGNRYMSFDIDDGYRYAARNNVSYDFRIVFLDQGTDSFKFQYKNKDNQWKESTITKTNTNLWKEVLFTVTDAFFNNNASEGANASDYATDFRLDFGGSPTVIHIIEVIGKGDLLSRQRPKAQVSCDLVKNDNDDPKEGFYSVGLNQDIKVKATLTDQNNKPLSNERIMFTYNTEWNYAKTIKTDANGKAIFNLKTENVPTRSGFVGGGGRSGTSPSWYSVQAYYPGSNNFQPSRNDCLMLVTNSSGPSDSKNTRMKIKDGPTLQSNSKYKVTYDILNSSGGVIETKSEEVGQNKAFYSDDPNKQTIQLSWTSGSFHASSNNITLQGNGSLPPESPYPSSQANVTLKLKAGFNFITLLYSNNIPSSCTKISRRVNNFFKSSPALVPGQKYYVSCSQNANW